MRPQSLMAQATTLFTAGLFALMAFFVKVVAVSVPPAEILFIRALISIVLIGLFGTAAQLFFSRPFKFIPTAEGSMVAPAYTVFTIILAVLFLGEVLSLRFVLGALLVFGSILYLMAREELRLRKSTL